MLFLTFNNANVQFAKKELTWRIYTTKKSLSIIRQVELIDQKEFAKAILDENIEAFVVHVSSLELRMTIYLARKAQLALLLAEKITILAKYLDFAYVFLKNSANILWEQIRVYEHTIKLEEGKQPRYGPIYSLELIELRLSRLKLRPFRSTTFLRPQSHQRVPRFCLYASPMVAFVCMLITENSITLQSKIGIRCCWLASP